MPICLDMAPFPSGISNPPHGPMLDLCQINPKDMKSPQTVFQKSRASSRMFLDPPKLPLEVSNTPILKI